MAEPITLHGSRRPRGVLVTDGKGDVYVARLEAPSLEGGGTGTLTLVDGVLAVDPTIADGGSATPGTTFDLLTNGDPVNPELVFDSDGDVIWVALP